MGENVRLQPTRCSVSNIRYHSRTRLEPRISRQDDPPGHGDTETHGAYLKINYTKEGRHLTNHVMVGPPCVNEDNLDFEFLGGILQEVDPSQVRMVAY
jgi:hypothetical protein